jgi:pyridoxamine 5'-phosphate oxidase
VAIHFKPLLETDVDVDPLRQFATWFQEAQYAGLEMPEAAALATAGAGGAPSARMVLVKLVDERGFVFFSNYNSRKAQELAANPRAALLFHWESLGRQVRIEGVAEHTSAEESARYARSRPRGSQLSALASPQSHPVESRQVLEERVVELAARHASGGLPLPEAWGGFRVVAEHYEFWQHRADRLHDRLHYLPVADGGWRIERLAP